MRGRRHSVARSPALGFARGPLHGSAQTTKPSNARAESLHCSLASVRVCTWTLARERDVCANLIVFESVIRDDNQFLRNVLANLNVFESVICDENQFLRSVLANLTVFESVICDENQFLTNVSANLSVFKRDFF